MRTNWMFPLIRSRINVALSCATQSTRIAMWAHVALLCGALSTVTGCQQTNGNTGVGGLAPISKLPQGQSPMNASLLPSFGPFGASARVPPPSTGSFGNDGTGGTAASAYGPSGTFNQSAGNVIPMSHTASDVLGSGVNQAGGAFAGVAQSLAPSNPNQWVETNTVAPNFPASAFQSPSQSGSALRGGMPVIDLTGAPPPPGYYPAQYPSNPIPSNSMPQQSGVPIAALPGQLPATQLAPAASVSRIAPTTAPFGSGALQPNAGSTMTNQSPAANQPSLPGADRSIQWRSPVRY